MNIFSKIRQGETASWADYAFTDTQGNSYQSNTHALTYVIAGPASTTILPLSLVAVAQGNGWTTSITAAQSAGLAVGRFFWAAYASKTGVRVTASTGYFDVLQDLLTAGTVYDGSTQNEKDLAAVRAEMTARIAGTATIEYSIGTRHLKKEPMSELIKMETHLIIKVRRDRAAEKIANGQGNPGRVLVKF